MYPLYSLAGDVTYSMYFFLNNFDVTSSTIVQNKPHTLECGLLNVSLFKNKDHIIHNLHPIF